MKKNKYDISELTMEQIEAEGLWKISKEPINVTFAKKLDTVKKIKQFKRHIVSEYNKTKDEAYLLESLKVIAIAEGNIAALASKSNMQRTNIYQFFRKGNHPTYTNLVKVAANLGIHFNVYVR
jgi:DNA-binding phage protein